MEAERIETAIEDRSASSAAGTAPIFVGGVPRSGTTLLRVILDSHPQIHSATELRAVPALARLWAACESSGGGLATHGYAVGHEALRETFAELVLAYLRPGWQASGKPRVAEKTPGNLAVFPLLRRLFPASPLVHVLRDGRDVVASRLERDCGPELRGTAAAAALARDRAHDWVLALEWASQWRRDPAIASAYIELRYEALVARPEATLQSLFTALGVEYHPRVLAFHTVARSVAGTEEWSAEAVQRPIFADSVGSWRHRLAPAELEAVLDVAGAALRDYTGGTS